MSDSLLEFTSNIASAKSAEDVGKHFLKTADFMGVCLLHAFMGTPEESFRVTTMPDWGVKMDCHRPDLMDCYTVQNVRAGIPRTLWGLDIDAQQIDRITPASLQSSRDRFEYYGQRTAMTFAMPDPDGIYRGAGAGFGFAENSAQFKTMLKEQGGIWAVFAFAAHSRMQQLLDLAPGKSPLTKRQAEILVLLANGMQLGQIADALVVSDSTINMHLATLKKRLNVKTKEQALAMALTNNWIAV
ncbi:helix-turn-helix transcriptional regulator [Epibacterium ulvae]|uniref:helix-turn-helix transcriptional regulator n=1 Tax=Epibacterium ulvae TaxID=1156985 RepID=UPI001BFC708A|nr:helix-turn-helix transcriptional regulator [Epibacterium ulvae]MBT8153127.1 helix-turn-helix transcriptional regulator [Epibacterium ulvae]